MYYSIELMDLNDDLPYAVSCPPQKPYHIWDILDF